MSTERCPTCSEKLGVGSLVVERIIGTTDVQTYCQKFCEHCLTLFKFPVKIQIVDDGKVHHEKIALPAKFEAGITVAKCSKCGFTFIPMNPTSPVCPVDYEEGYYPNV